jgi:gamma-glutamyl phosphate reductase
VLIAVLLIAVRMVCLSSYVDKAADVAKAVKVVVDGETTYPAACNATETLLVHTHVLATVSALEDTC